MDREIVQAAVVVARKDLHLQLALSLIGQAVIAYRALLRDSPQDYFESARRQQEAADLLDQAQTTGAHLTGNDYEEFGEAFGQAYAEIEKLESRRIGGDDESDARTPDHPGAETKVVKLIGGPFHGQTRALEALDSSSDDDAGAGPPNRIELPVVTDREIRMLVYLRDAEESGGVWKYFHIDPLDQARSMNASLAMDTPVGKLTEALALLDVASQEYRKRNDAGNQRGLEALNTAVVISQNELTEAEQEVFAVRRASVQKEANEAEDAAAFDPDWDHSIEEDDSEIEVVEE